MTLSPPLPLPIFLITTIISTANPLNYPLLFSSLHLFYQLLTCTFTFVDIHRKLIICGQQAYRRSYSAFISPLLHQYFACISPIFRFYFDFNSLVVRPCSVLISSIFRPHSLHNLPIYIAYIGIHQYLMEMKRNV